MNWEYQGMNWEYQGSLSTFLSSRPHRSTTEVFDKTIKRANILKDNHSVPEICEHESMLILDKEFREFISNSDLEKQK